MKMSTPLTPSWVHSLDDYQKMFNLEAADFQQPLLDCPAGISSFNADLTALGYTPLSVDQDYSLPLFEMAEHVKNRLRLLAVHLKPYADRIEGHLPEILKAWKHCAKRFLADYEQGLSQGRYQYAKLTRLPFGEKQFKLALCADLSLGPDAQTDPAVLITELCRVAEEVRVFPLLDQSEDAGSALGAVMLGLQQANFGVEIREVPYRLLKGNNAMLRVWAKECTVSTK